MPTKPEAETGEEKGLRKLFEQIAGSVSNDKCNFYPWEDDDCTRLQ